MDLRLIKYFVIVAQELNFSRAAAKLHIEQSPLSRAIRKLETQYDTKLFIRGGRQLKLTFPGELLLKEAFDVLDRYDQLERNVRWAAQSYQGITKIAVSDEINPIQLSILLSEIRLQRPDIHLQIDEMHYLDALNALGTGTCDISIAQTSHKAEAFEVIQLWDKSLSVLLPADHLLNDKASINLKEVLAYPAILYDDSYYGHNFQLRNLIASQRIRLNKVIYAKSFEMMYAMVAAGLGLGVCTNSWFHHSENSKVKLRILSDREKINTYLISIDNAVCRQVKQIIVDQQMKMNSQSQFLT